MPCCFLVSRSQHPPLNDFLPRLQCFWTTRLVTEFSTLHYRSSQPSQVEMGSSYSLWPNFYSGNKPSTPATELGAETCFPGVTPTFPGGEHRGWWKTLDVSALPPTVELLPCKQVGTGQSGPIILGLMYWDRASVLQVRAGLGKVDLITSAMPSGNKPSAT